MFAWRGPLRILFTFAGDSGHFHPLVPIARACAAAGHTVAVGTRPRMMPVVRAAGFEAFAAEPAAGRPPKRIPLQPLDQEREDRDLRDGFADRLARVRAAGLLALAETWRPDLVVCDEVDFGSVVAAESLGVPYATVAVMAAGSFVRSDLVAEPLSRLRAEQGLPPDPGLEMLSRYLVLSPVPPSFRDPAFPPPATAHTISPLTEEHAGEPLPPLSGKPLVYFTLGTVFNLESGDLFERVLAGLGRLPVDVVATVGREIDPAELGPQPPNVHVERFIPQSAILPRCRVVVSHGGSGSVIGALAHGVPVVLLPMGADQLLNAARCEALGVGRVLDPTTVTPERVRESVSAVLEDGAYRCAAGRLRAEAVAAPGPAHAVELLERLAATRQPLLSTCSVETDRRSGPTDTPRPGERRSRPG
jgi:UDP:flavonoid glycosyltransferase YjiC (YdhE family)